MKSILFGVALALISTAATAATQEALCQSQQGQQHYMKVMGNGQTVNMNLIDFTFVKSGESNGSNISLYANGEHRQVLALMDSEKVRYYLVRDEKGKTVDSGVCEKRSRY